MKPLHKITNNNLDDRVDTESRYAWVLWKKINDFSDFLWKTYEYDFLTLAAAETHHYDNNAADRLENATDDNLPF